MTDDAVHDALNEALSGRYTIIRELGRGGMATVFLARDVRHSREVAIKVMQRDVVAPNGAERFLHEIGFAARLTHPHVLGVHDSGETDGLLYYVMPFVDGETLRARIARDGALPLADATRFMRELAGALAYAHAQGVVHRDLKPENVLLSGGHAVVADFGIAKAIADGTRSGAADSAKLTGTGMSIGTPAYMAPEQAVGDKSTDHRADLYALGVIAYEMISGAHPFGERSPQALVAAHLTEAPAPLAARRTNVPPALAALVSQLLSKEPAERPQSAGEVVHALDAITAGATSIATAAANRPGRAKRMIIGVALIIVAAASLAAWRAFASRGPRTIRAIAVLPFANIGGDTTVEYFSDGLTEDLAHALTGIPGLSMPGRTETHAFKGTTLGAQKIGRSLDVDALVEGTVRRTLDHLRVTVELVSAVDGKLMWESSYDRPASEVFALQDQFTHAVAAALAHALGGRAAETPAIETARGTDDLDAYQLYLQGRYYWHIRGAENLRRSIDYFKQAVARDPKFARAYAGMSSAYDAYLVFALDPLDTIHPLMLASAARALQLDSTLADSHIASAQALEREAGGAPLAMAHYRKAIAIEPANQYAHHSFGLFLMAHGRTDESISEGEKGARLDLLAKSAGTGYALELTYARRGAEAVAEARRVVKIDTTFALAYQVLGFAQVVNGQFDSAIVNIEHARQLSPGAPSLLDKLMFAYVAAGRWSDADKLRATLHRGGDGRQGGLEAAYADLLFGDRGPLLRMLSTASGQRAATEHYWFGCNPMLDPLRSDERFQAIMKTLDVEPCAPEKPWAIPPRR